MEFKKKHKPYKLTTLPGKNDSIIEYFSAEAKAELSYPGGYDWFFTFEEARTYAIKKLKEDIVSFKKYRDDMIYHSKHIEKLTKDDVLDQS